MSYARGAKNLAAHNSTVVSMMGLSAITLMLAKGHGANVNLEKALTSAFVVTVLLVALSSANPGLATVLAAMVLVSVLIEYGDVALKGVGTGTSLASVPKIATTGDLALGTAALAGTYVGVKAAGGAVSGLAQGASQGLLGSLLGKLKSLFTVGGAEEAVTIAGAAA